MKVELIDPLKKPAQIRITYNDKELFIKDFAAGETPKLDFETPQETGVARAFLIIDGKEIPLGSATYDFDGGQPDNHQNDHDGDGLPDRGPQDQDGDGLPDRGPQDQDGDGLPDRGTADDDDGDGLPDRDSGDLPV